ncbi:neprilysin-2 isoform X3 [Microplitis demolitor]|nr:neprilysin-2 isoform X3 [Microplitis demolitor]
MMTAENLKNTINPSRNKSNCTTREYVKDNLEFELALLYNMNASVDPCDNFYKFACGNFDNVPADYLQPVNHDFGYPISSIYEKIIYLIRNDRLNSPKQFKFLRDFITSCESLNINNNNKYFNIREDKLDDLTDVLSKLGQWPVLEGPKWNSTDFNWVDFEDKAGNFGVDTTYYFHSMVNLDKGGKRFHLNSPKFEFSYEDIKNYRNDSMINAYHKYMVGVAMLLGANETQAKIELMESLKFELKLINISNNNNISNYVKNKKRMSLKEIKESWSSINWEKLMALPNETKTQPFFTNESIIFIENCQYITELEKLINKTPKKVQANYVVWKTIQSLIPYIKSKSLHKLRLTYSKTRNQSNVSNDESCFGQLANLLPNLIIYYYSRRYPINGQAQHRVNQLIEDIKQKYVDTLNSTNWLDDKTKDLLMAEINSLKFINGYPVELFDDKTLDEYLQGLDITSGNFLKNYINIKLFSRKKLIDILTSSNDSIDWMKITGIVNPLQANAFNFYSANTIVLGIELLRNLYFSIYRPDYTNLATIGTTIGHEIGHSIHVSYKAENNFGIKDNGWSVLTDKKFSEIEECFIEQYSNYSYEATEKKLNGSFYLNENFADNFGIQVAYSVYQDWLKKNGPKTTYSSLPYNSNQLFWLTYATRWCTSKSSLLQVDSTDEHAPVDKRVIGVVSNSREFSKDFSCPIGSHMNPVKKCSVF